MVFWLELIMDMDYKWGQHTVAEALYDNGIAVQVRIPVGEVVKGRELFTAKDYARFEPHIDLFQEPYQFHIFSEASEGSYINDVPFDYVKKFLWYLHRHKKIRDDLAVSNTSIHFSDFTTDDELPGKAGITYLDYGHEKYGFFDSIPKGSFLTMQLHRLALYGRFLKEQGHNFTDDDIKGFLPPRIRRYVDRSYSIEEAVLMSASSVDKGFTSHSIHEALTFVFDGASARQEHGNMRVCRNHDNPIYWSGYWGRTRYRIVPDNENAGETRKLLADIVEEECPICDEKKIKRPA